MITTTADALIRGAMLDIGVLADGQSPKPSESEDGLVALNLLADALGIEPGMLYTLVRTAKTLANGTASYTVGSGASINIPRPASIFAAGLILDTAASPPQQVPLPLLTDLEYAQWPDKTQQASLSAAAWYSRGNDASGYGTIYPLPIPNVGTTQLVLYTLGGQISTFTLADDVVMPSGLALTLRKNLALDLADQYPAAVVSPRLVNRAAHLKRTFKNATPRDTKRSNSPMLVGGGTFDIDTGMVR